MGCRPAGIKGPAARKQSRRADGAMPRPCPAVATLHITPPTLCIRKIGVGAAGLGAGIMGGAVSAGGEFPHGCLRAGAARAPPPRKGEQYYTLRSIRHFPLPVRCKGRCHFCPGALRVYSVPPASVHHTYTVRARSGPSMAARYHMARSGRSSFKVDVYCTAAFR